FPPRGRAALGVVRALTGAVMERVRGHADQGHVPRSSARAAAVVHPVMHLQLAAGNRAVSELVASRSACGPSCGCSSCAGDRSEAEMPSDVSVQREEGCPNGFGPEDNEAIDRIVKDTEASHLLPVG